MERDRMEDARLVKVSPTRLRPPSHPASRCINGLVGYLLSFWRDKMISTSSQTCVHGLE